MLRNKLYIGIATLKGKEYSLDIPKIVDIKKFERVQRIVSKRRLMCKYDYLFNGMVRCACGNHTSMESSIKIKNEKIYLYYYCDKCKKRINEMYLMNDVIDYLMRIAKDDYKNKDFKKYKKEVWRLEELKSSIYTLYIQQHISAETYVQEMKKIEKDLHELRKDNKKYIDNYLAYFNSLSLEEKKILIDRNIKNIVVDIERKEIVKIE